MILVLSEDGTSTLNLSRCTNNSVFTLLSAVRRVIVAVFFYNCRMLICLDFLVRANSTKVKPGAQSEGEDLNPK